MDKFDVIVIGSGAGMGVVYNAIAEGLTVALIERGPLGGTCLNNGCIPSKMLIYPADVVTAIRDAGRLGIDAEIQNIDFKNIMNRMRSFVAGQRTDMEEELKDMSNLTLFRETSEFVDEMKLDAGGNTITAPRIAIVSGSRPAIPPIPGLRESGYLDNVSLLDLTEPPESLIIMGGGYIGCEYGHFFSAMGTDVTLIGRSPVLLNNEDLEVSEVLTESLSRFISVRTSHEVIRVEKEGDKKAVYAKNLIDGMEYRFIADEILVALGREPNSDLLKPERTGIETDRKGWIKVNQYLETTRKGIWAYGDAIGKNMFRHTANYQAEIVSQNMLFNKKIEDDEHAVPHAVFTHPQVGAVGLMEHEAKQKGYKVKIGKARYTDTAKGNAMMEEEGFVKVVVEDGTYRILGCAVVGPEASDLVQQVVYLMNAGNGDWEPIWMSQVIHPAMSEVVVRAFSNLK
mgnify:CR=1 FL=1